MGASKYCGTVLSFISLLAFGVAYLLGAASPYWVRYSYHKPPYSLTSAGLWQLCIDGQACEEIDEHYPSLQAFMHASRILLYLGIISLGLAVVANLVWLSLIFTLNRIYALQLTTGVLTLLAAMLGVTSTIVFGVSYSNSDTYNTEWAFWLLIASCAALCYHAGSNISVAILACIRNDGSATSTYVVQYPNHNGNDGKVFFVNDAHVNQE